MANTSVVYEGDDLVTNFTVPFPFISRDHVKVYVNLEEVLSPTWWTWVSDSQISFRVAPASGDAVRISRVTPGDTRLVDFQNGAVLTEADLDLSANQNFYLAQEAYENYAALVNGELIRIGSSAGVMDTTPDAIIAGLINFMLEDASAATLQARVSDIDQNAESIIDLQNGIQVQINTLAQGTAAVVYVQATEPVPGVGGVPDPIPDNARWYDSDDNNAPYIYDSGLAQWISIEDPRIGQAEADITVLQTDVNDNAAAVVAESVARSNADSAFASTLALIGAQNGALTAFIVDTNTVKIDSDVGDTFAQRFSSLSVSDSDNAANIISEQNARISADTVLAEDISLIGARNAGATAFILDSSTVKIDSDVGDTVAQKFTSLEAADGTLQSNIDSEQTARISADGVLTTDMSLIGARNAGATAFILDSNTVKIDSDGGQTFAQKITSLEAADSSNTASITTINTVTIPGVQADADAAQTDADAAQADATTALAKYGVTLQVNDYITGFAQNNDGKTGAFAIMADKFAIIDPGTLTQRIFWDGGASKLQIDGDLIVSGSINGGQALSTTLADRIDDSHINVSTLSALAADLGTVTAGTITLNSGGHIKSGATAYETGSGFWLGYSGGSKFYIGNKSAGQYLSYDSTNGLTVQGTIFLGEYEASNTVLMSADTERTETSTTVWSQKKAFTSDRAGSVRIKAEVKHAGGSLLINPQWRVKKEGVVVSAELINGSVYYSDQIDVTGVAVGDSITVELLGGTTSVTAYIKNVDFCATVIIPAEGGTVDQN